MFQPLTCCIRKSSAVAQPKTWKHAVGARIAVCWTVLDSLARMDGLMDCRDAVGVFARHAIGRQPSNIRGEYVGCGVCSHSRSDRITVCVRRMLTIAAGRTYTYLSCRTPNELKLSESVSIWLHFGELVSVCVELDGQYYDRTITGRSQCRWRSWLLFLTH